MSAEQSSTQPEPNTNPATSSADNPAQEGNQLAQSLSASMGANMRRTANGDVDILHAIGGWRGLVESSLPAVAFLVLFTVTKELHLSLIAALAAAGVFTLIRLVQGSKLVSALTGLVGVAICAFAAYRTGNASDYFVVGFWTNGVYILAYLLSMLVRWPLMGLIFAVIRGEALSWRQNPVRLRQYMLATWIITVLMMLRLAVQVPLYFANNVEALGATRLIMGLPLYALGVWLAWRVSAPEEALVSENLEDPEALNAEVPAAETPDADGAEESGESEGSENAEGSAGSKNR